MRIRPYEEKDRENVRHVCIVTAGCADKSEDEKQFILTLYCDYYIEKEPDNCFVIADDEDNAVGYILCAENFSSCLPPHCGDGVGAGFDSQGILGINPLRRKQNRLEEAVQQATVG